MAMGKTTSCDSKANLDEGVGNGEVKSKYNNKNEHRISMIKVVYLKV